MKRSSLLRVRPSACVCVPRVSEYRAEPCNVVAHSRTRGSRSPNSLSSFKSPQSLGIGLSGRYSYRKLF